MDCPFYVTPFLHCRLPGRVTETVAASRAGVQGTLIGAQQRKMAYGLQTLRGMTRCSQGFTLIELLVTVAIIGILAAIAIPVMGQYRARAYDSAAITDLRNAMTAIEAAISSEDPPPANPNDLQLYGYRPSDGVTFVRYQVGNVSGLPDVHMHTQHAGSRRAWHTRYPSDGGRIEVRN